MTRLLPFLFFVILGGAALGATWYNYSTRATINEQLTGEPQPAFTAYLTSRVKDFLFPPPEVVLADFLPEAPSGWKREAYQTAHGEAVVGVKKVDTAIAINSTNNLLTRLDRSPRQRAWIVESYIKGDKHVIVAVRLYTPSEMETLEFAMAKRLRGVQLSADGLNAPERTAAVSHGVPVIRSPRLNRALSGDLQLVDYTEYSVDLGPQLQVDVITNATQDAAFQILQRIDLAGLNAQQVEPMKGVDASKPFEARPEVEFPVEAELRAAGDDVVAQPLPEEVLETNGMGMPTSNAIMAAIKQSLQGAFTGKDQDSANGAPVDATDAAAVQAPKDLPAIKRPGDLQSSGAVCVMRAGQRSCN